jgi:hypothetical protein
MRKKRYHRDTSRCKLPVVLRNISIYDDRDGIRHR